MTALIPILPGTRFGALTVLSRLPNDHSNATRYLCACDCGATARPRASMLRFRTSDCCGSRLQTSRIVHAAARIRSRPAWVCP